jgi:hypothetical protein
VDSFKDIIHPLQLDLVRDRLFSVSSLKEMKIIPLLPVLELRWWLMYNLPPVKEVKCSLAHGTKKRILVAYHPHIF